MSGLEFLLCVEKQEGPRRTQKEHKQWVCRVSSLSWELRFESAWWKFRHEATRGDVLGVGRWIIRFGFIKIFSNIPGVVWTAFSVRKQFNKVFIFVSTPQQTKTHALNQISLFWECLARTNPNSTQLPTLFYNLYLQVKRIQTHSKLLLQNTSIVNFHYPY